MQITEPKYRFTFWMLIVLFFLWAFLTDLNDSLVPYVKQLFDLNYTQASLVQFCFFGAFFLMAVPATWILKRWGYRLGIVFGLLLMALGCVLFYPASTLVYYPIFLGALFVLATGVTILQVAANPYVSILGPEETSAARLNLAQGFNSFAKVLAPMFGAYFILSKLKMVNQADQAAAVQLPYFGLAIALILIAILFYLIKLPDMHELEHAESESHESAFNIKDHPQLKFAIIAIFCYVGAEVAIGSFMINYIKQDSVLGISEELGAKYLSMYWGSLMIGRFLGFFVLQMMKSSKLLMIAAGLAVLFCFGGMALTGSIAMWSLILVGLCNSIMWSNIFTLGIEGLGKWTSKASGYLVAAIVGGAIVPFIQGGIADLFSLSFSYIVPVFCYIYILWFARRCLAVR